MDSDIDKNDIDKSSVNGETERGDGARGANRALHPLVYGIEIGLVLWFVLGVLSFGSGGVGDFLLVIGGGFILVVIALIFILPRIERPIDPAHRRDTLRDWAKENFGTWTGPLQGAQAATQILLPLAAAAVGMTMIGLVFLITEHSVA